MDRGSKTDMTEVDIRHEHSEELKENDRDCPHIKVNALHHIPAHLFDRERHAIQKIEIGWTKFIARAMIRFQQLEYLK